MVLTRLCACAAAWWIAGCLQPGAVVCGDGRVCPTGTACDDTHALCVVPQQLTSCPPGAAAGTECAISSTLTGSCQDGVCLPHGCRNHIVDGSEECDGELRRADLTGCADVGFYQPGPLGCRSDCTIDTSPCTGARCGDGIVDLDHGEQCDGLAFAGASDCSELGYYDPRPATCNPLTCRIDVSQCTGFCGDGIVNDDSEQCDGDERQLGTADCTDLGYYDPGPLDCRSNCTIFVSQCTGFCGDAVVDPAHGEQCDGAEFAGDHDCRQLGYYDARPADCNHLTCRIDVSACTGYCGNGIVDGPESCEAAAGWQRTEQCADFGFDFGTLGCSSACAPDFAACGVLGWRRVGASQAPAMFAIAGVSAQDVWGIGIDHDSIHHWNGTQWTSVFNAVHGQMSALYAVAGDVWLGGDAGSIWRWDHGAWHQSRGPSLGYVTVIVGAPAGELWALVRSYDTGSPGDRDNDRVARRDPQTGLWADQPGYSGARPNAAWVSPSGTPWIVGDGGAAFRGGVRIDLGTTADLTAVWGFSDDDVDVATAGAVLHWDGRTWTEQVVPLATIGSLWGTSARNLWASEPHGALARFDGRVWLRLDPPPGDNAMVWGTGVDDVWIAGTTVWRSRGRQWSSEITSPMPIATQVLGLAGTDEHNLWLSLANDATTSIQRFDGSRLTPIDPGDFRRGWGTGPDDMWFASPLGIWHWDGTHYAPSHGPLSSDLDPPTVALWGSGPRDVWVVSGQGATVHFNGSSWQSFETPGIAWPRSSDVWGFTPTDAWMAGVWQESGTFGRFVHWDGSSWLHAPISLEPLRSVWGAALHDLWAVGDQGAILHKDQAGWALVPGNPGRGLALTRVRGSAPDDVWAIGQAGAILHYDGARWAPVRSPAGDQDLIDLVVTPGRVFFASTTAVYTLDRPRPLACAAAERQCGDGVDDDCDGRIDLDDTGCQAGPRLQRVSNGAVDYFEVSSTATATRAVNLDGLVLEWRQACDASPQRYRFPADAILEPGGSLAVTESPAAAPNRRWLGSQMCDGPDRNGWFALCAGPCDLTRCTNIIDIVAQGVPPWRPTCVAFHDEIDLTDAPPIDGLQRVRFDGFGTSARATDWALLPIGHD